MAARDTREVFRFLSLEAPAAAELRCRFHVDPRIDALMCVKDGALRHSSEAALCIARCLGWPYSVATVFALIPRTLRDRVYALIARHRHTLAFGASCTLDVEVAKRLVNNDILYDDLCTMLQL